MNRIVFFDADEVLELNSANGGYVIHIVLDRELKSERRFQDERKTVWRNCTFFGGGNML